MYNFLILIAVLIIISFLTRVIDNIHYNNNFKDGKKLETIYKKKRIMTKAERDFYDKIKYLEPEYKVIPQVNLASIVSKENNNRYYTDLFRNIDFAIFDNNLEKVLLLIELNDGTHNLKKRKRRDYKIKKICNATGIPLLFFYTRYPNEKDYVINRIKNVINKTEENDLIKQNN